MSLAYTLEKDRHSGRWKLFSVRSIGLAKKNSHSKENRRVEIVAPSLQEALNMANRKVVDV